MSDLITGNTSYNTTISVGSSVMAEIESELKARKDFPSNLTTPKKLLAKFLKRASEGAGFQAGVRIIDLADLLVTGGIGKIGSLIKRALGALLHKCNLLTPTRFTHVGT